MKRVGNLKQIINDITQKKWIQPINDAQVPKLTKLINYLFAHT
jgi:hypothetical protein